MRSDDLAPLLGPGGRPQIGMRQGILITWNPSTGANTVTVAGQTFTDLPILASGTLAMAPGDQIALLRFGNTYFILGAIRAAGVGTLSNRAQTIVAEETRQSATYGDLATVGPTLTDVYIGASRQCLVLISVSAGAGANNLALASVEVSGASSISASSNASAAAFISSAGATPVTASASSFVFLDAAKGLNEGLNTFRLKYACNSATTECAWKNRHVSVIPF